MSAQIATIESGTKLARYDAARFALQEAVSVDEVKDIRDKALAMAAYAKQAGDKSLVEMATEIRTRAERKAGEMLAAMPKADGGDAQRTRLHKGTESPPTLSELGVTKQQSSRWQKLAAVPEDEFEEAVETAKAGDGIVSSAAILREREVADNYRANGTGQNEWYTPSDVIARVRQVMEIDVDPASNDEANETVGATEYFTKDDDGLSKEWRGNVWLNPPYSRDLMPKFVDKLIEEYESGRCRQAILVAHNNTDTAWFQRLAAVASAVCFPAKRIKFYRGADVAAPVNGQVFVYLGNDAHVFIEAFSSTGVTFRDKA